MANLLGVLEIGVDETSPESSKGHVFRSVPSSPRIGEPSRGDGDISNPFPVRAVPFRGQR